MPHSPHTVDFIGLMFWFHTFLFLTPLMLSVVPVLFLLQFSRAGFSMFSCSSVLPANIKGIGSAIKTKWLRASWKLGVTWQHFVRLVVSRITCAVKDSLCCAMLLRSSSGEIVVWPSVHSMLYPSRQLNPERGKASSPL